MATIPPPRTRRYQVVKFIYTADNNDRYVRTQRIDKDANGGTFLGLPSCMQTVTINAKDKIWGTPDNLRKTVIEYPEPNNQAGVAQITRYVPDPPTSGTNECVKQIIGLADTKFGSLGGTYCMVYTGENRWSFARPRRIS